MNNEWMVRYDAARDAARQAAQLALRSFDAGLPVEWKDNQSPVTAADRNAELLLRELLLDTFPDDGFLGEEFGAKPGTSGYRWIIDPIDGTRNYCRGIPVWATLVGLEQGGRPVLGVVDAPALMVNFRAMRGDGAYRNDRPIRVSGVDQMRGALMDSSSPTVFVQRGCGAALLNLAGKVQRARAMGTFYGYVLVAQGAADVMVGLGVSPWDVAALRPIVEEAGGRFTDWDGTPTSERPAVVATNGLLHDEVVELLAVDSE